MEFSIASDTYLLPTPAGAFWVAAEPDNPTPMHRLMVELFAHPVTPAAAAGLLTESGLAQEQETELIGKMEALGWLQGLPAPRHAPEGPLDTLLSTLLPRLTQGGKVLLADSQGFYVNSQGFAHEVAEELSVLSADLAVLHERRRGSLNRSLGISGSAWGLTDAAGQSQLGFWPIHAGKERFVLIIAGMPTFNRPQLIDLVWALHQRYAAPLASFATPFPSAS